MHIRKYKIIIWLGFILVTLFNLFVYTGRMTWGHQMRKIDYECLCGIWRQSSYLSAQKMLTELTDVVYGDTDLVCTINFISRKEYQNFMNGKSIPHKNCWVRIRETYTNGTFYGGSWIGGGNWIDKEAAWISRSKKCIDVLKDYSNEQKGIFFKDFRSLPETPREKVLNREYSGSETAFKNWEQKNYDLR